ncbi:peptidylprolyl isomerase [Erythrobacter sp. F6033]|uniref:peptidylprolyl isomerase n=1 Tax=Erythrobacter sp. F6033 TaxID=2926401 RepID=UPI001FF497DF|nr:peptidylprolyl isomerase [Erythrobacter sp. F6033]MCK0127843.1 peptidylprolyl isomerase [Erythrobacter sp. F6033]
MGFAALPASAQDTAQPIAADPFNFPDNFDIFGTEEVGERSATAVVNGHVITRTDINQRVALLTSASQNQFSEDDLKRLRVQILRNLIDETLKIQAAQAIELPASRAEVEQTYQQLAVQNFGQNPERMAEYLNSIGSSPAALKRQIEGEIAWENLLRRNITPFVNVSAEEVNDVLRRMEEARGTDEYRLSEIYVNATTENRATVLANIQGIMEQLRQGGSFAAYARQYSEATTAVVGGDLGWIRLPQLKNASLEDAARSMQPGQLVGPIEIPGGFSILYLTNKRQVLMADPNNAVLNLKQIAITFEPDVTQAVAEAKVAEFDAFVQTLRGCADAGRAETELGASVVENNDISASRLPDQLRNMVLNLQIGQTTRPFGTPQDGVRVLMLCGRDDPEDSGAPTFEEVMNQLEQERITKRAQRYLRDLRNDAYIETN